MKRILLGSLILLFSLLLVACGGGSPAGNDNANDTENGTEGAGDGLSAPVNLNWASGPQGGVWYSAAGGLSSLLKEHDGNLNLKAIPGGTVQNLAFNESGEAELSWNMSFFANLAINGEDPFESEYQNLMAVGSGLGDSTFHFAINSDNEYDSLEEIFTNGNIKIALAPAANSDDFIFQKIMEFYDTSYEKMEENGVSFFQGSYTEQAEQFKNSNVDAIFALSGLPGSSITDASISRDLKILPFPDDLIAYLEDFGFAQKTIPADTYSNVTNGDEDILTMTAYNVIMVNKNVEEDVVYEIVKGINENTDRLESIHGSLASYDIELAPENLGQVELHPGAVKYYQEVGVME